jgi:L-threonylcarbamoyladenylate synthase
MDVDLKVKTEHLDARNGSDIAQAAAILRGGGTVAFPTETVYGLGADALNPGAVAKIFEAKQRPDWDPLIVHVCDRAMLERVCTVPANAQRLIDRFWPGPLTLLLPRTVAVPDAVTAGRPLVGVRMPNSPVALELIRQAGVPIAAPSANTFGHTSPTTAEHVLADLDGRIDAVLDGGATQVGLESTVVGLYHDPDEHWDGVTVYRAGAISLAMLDEVLGAGAAFHYCAPITLSDAESLPSPGVGIRHYAPKARLVLVKGLRDEELAHTRQVLELSLVETIDRSYDGVEIVGVMLPDHWNASCAQRVFRWGDWRNGEVLAQRLFAGLRELDGAGATVIVCPVPEMAGIGDAIRDRLAKAAK